MNYILKVDTCNIDKVVLKLSSHGDAIKIKNILRNQGTIYVKTKLIAEIKLIQEVITVTTPKMIPQFLFF